MRPVGLASPCTESTISLGSTAMRRLLPSASCSGWALVVWHTWQYASSPEAAANSCAGKISSRAITSSTTATSSSPPPRKRRQSRVRIIREDSTEQGDQKGQAAARRADYGQPFHPADDRQHDRLELRADGFPFIERAFFTGGGVHGGVLGGGGALGGGGFRLQGIFPALSRALV